MVYVVFFLTVSLITVFIVVCCGQIQSGRLRAACAGLRSGGNAKERSQRGYR